jgi:hypothetical protein
VSEPADIQPIREPPAASPQPLAPPTTPGIVVPAGRRHRTIWPTVIGIICLVYAALTGLASLYGVLTSLMASMMFGSTPQANPEHVARLARWSYVAAGTKGANVLIMGLLVWAAIELILRSPRAARLMRGWAWAQVLFVVWVIFVNSMFYVAQADVMFDAMSRATPPPGATTMPAVPAMTGMRSAMVGAYLAMSLVTGLGWGWPLPIFVLIWLRRPTVHDETAQWGAAPPTRTS